MSMPPACRLRVRYVKRGRLKYLGHLEVLHTVERIVRRAGLPYAVTQGFSPHMKLGFSSALPVGTSSSCEWYDLFMNERVELSEALKRLRAASPEDLAPVECTYIDVYAPALTACLTDIGYRMRLYPMPDATITAESLVKAADSVRALHVLEYARGKKSKKLDLDHTLLGVTACECDDGSFEMTLTTHADNEGSMRPELLVAAMDRVLSGRLDSLGTDPVATGVQHLATFEKFEVERIWQTTGEGADAGFAAVGADPSAQ